MELTTQLSFGQYTSREYDQTTGLLVEPLDDAQAGQDPPAWSAFEFGNHLGNNVFHCRRQSLTLRRPLPFGGMAHGRYSRWLLDDDQMLVEVADVDGFLLLGSWCWPRKQFHRVPFTQPPGRVEHQVAADANAPGFNKTACLPPGNVRQMSAQKGSQSDSGLLG